MSQSSASPSQNSAPSEPDFILPEAQLRLQRSAKWASYPDDVLPAFVAEMDFAAAPAIQKAMQHAVEMRDYGYPKRQGFARPEHTIAAAFADRMQALYGWQISRDDVQAVSDLVQATYAGIMAYSAKGDGVLLQVPAYSPFFEAIHDTGRVLRTVRMRDTGDRHEIDFDEMAVLARSARVIALCHPQNPTGRVLTETELEQIGRIAVDHDLVIVSDEIHAELVYMPNRHIPIAMVGADVAARTVTINSPTKCFNIPGLRAAVMHFGSAALKQRFYEALPRKVLGQVSGPSMDAAVAAWRDSDAWMAEVAAYLRSNRDHLTARLRAELPETRFHVPELTYLAWLDFSAYRLNVPPAEFFLKQARVALSGGDDFDAEAGAPFARLNFGTSRILLDQIIDRMVAAIRSHSS